VVRAVLDRQRAAWDGEIVTLRSGAWLVLLRCRSLTIDCGFRVEIENQCPSHIGGWVARMAGEPSVPSSAVVPQWPRDGFATYAERRSPPQPAGAPAAYEGIERRRAGRTAG
jgi:hypothetical protein